MEFLMQYRVEWASAGANTLQRVNSKPALHRPVEPAGVFGNYENGGADALRGLDGFLSDNCPISLILLKRGHKLRSLFLGRTGVPSKF
jgi:hypothetical protein